MKVYKTEVFDSEGTLALIDPDLSDPLVQSDAVYVQRLRDLNSPEPYPPFVTSDEEYQAIIDRISWAVGLTDGEFTLLAAQVQS